MLKKLFGQFYAKLADDLEDPAKGVRAVGSVKGGVAAVDSAGVTRPLRNCGSLPCSCPLRALPFVDLLAPTRPEQRRWKRQKAKNHEK